MVFPGGTSPSIGRPEAHRGKGRLHSYTRFDYISCYELEINDVFCCSPSLDIGHPVGLLSVGEKLVALRLSDD